MKYPSFAQRNPFLGIIDIYEQNDFNAKLAFEAGIRLVIHKIGQWKSWQVDSNRDLYLQCKAEWQALNGLWMNYILPLHNVDPDQCLEQAANVDSDPTVLTALDWEPDGTGLVAPLSTIESMASTLHRQTGRYPVLYSYRSLIQENHSPILDACPLWLADPLPINSHSPTIYLPPHWSGRKPILWQWSDDDFTITKQSDGTDYNAFDGTYTELAEFVTTP